MSSKKQHIDAPPQKKIPRAVNPAEVPAGADLTHPGLYFNRELGWVDFNWRVLHFALDERTPLLERVRFIAITASNLDEFVQKRVGGLKRQEAAGVTKLSPDGRTPSDQLKQLHAAIAVMHQTMTATWERTLKPLLQKQIGVEISNYNDLTAHEKELMHEYYQQQLYPVLTPLTVDPGHPFPFISNLSLSLAIILQHPNKKTTYFARLKILPDQPRFLPVPGRKAHRFLPIEQLIAAHADELFPGVEVLEVHPFRVVRNADVSRDEEEAFDLLAIISEELRERRFAPVVSLEVEKGMSERARALLIDELDLLPEDISEVDGQLGLTDCFQIANLPFPNLQFPQWLPVLPVAMYHQERAEGSMDIFSLMREGDFLVHHPYESFNTSVERLIQEASIDPQVLAIKQTLYRTSDQSPIIDALIQAAEKGKQVSVLVEVKARFDEANNIEWGRALANAGVHVAYGLVGLKTHTKVTLILRREGDALRTYCHIGTGNYNPKTARLYTDLGLFTCNPELGHDVVNLFHSLTGYALKPQFEKVLVAPYNMRQTFYDLIDQEIQYQQQHGDGRIILKMNAIDDTGIIRKLYEASQAGVQIDLIIRGHTRLRPGLKGYSENIRIISILGRFLEHDRIFYFHHHNQPRTYIGSADWRGRNLNDRVELIAPVESPQLQKQLINLLEMALNDNCLAWDLDSQGDFSLRYPKPDEPERNFHTMLMEKALAKQL